MIKDDKTIFGNYNWQVLDIKDGRDPLKLVLPKAFAPPSARPGIFICSLVKASFHRSPIKMPLQLCWKGICARDWIRTSTPRGAAT
jgi:hypothetical protein